MTFLSELTKEQKVSKIKIFVGDKLIGQVIGPDYAYINSLWSRWTMMRYRKDKGLGCAIIMRADKD